MCLSGLKVTPTSTIKEGSIISFMDKLIKPSIITYKEKFMKMKIGLMQARQDQENLANQISSIMDLAIKLNLSEDLI